LKSRLVKQKLKVFILYCIESSGVARGKGVDHLGQQSGGAEKRQQNGSDKEASDISRLLRMAKLQSALGANKPRYTTALKVRFGIRQFTQTSHYPNISLDQFFSTFSLQWNPFQQF